MASSFFLMLLAVALYSLVHSLLASLWAKARARRWFGSWSDRYYRLSYNIFALLSFLPVLALLRILPDQPLYTIPPPWAYLFIAMQTLSLAMLLIGLLQTDVWAFLGIRQLFAVNANSPNMLVASGLYRWVRHPLYTAGMGFLWFNTFMTVNLLAFNLGLTLYLIIGAYYEEGKLLVEFGEAYARYRQKTPMFLPRLRRT